MRFEFRNHNLVRINRNLPTSVRSTINVADVNGTISKVTLAFNILHTFTSDLVVTLRSPSGQSATLVNREGGSGNHFLGTVFDDASTSSIANARPPFKGGFRPAESLNNLDGANANGEWILEIDDVASQDGGLLLSWTLGFMVQRETSKFKIELDFQGGLSPSQRRVFANAAERWSEIITGAANGSSLSLTIEAGGIPIDRGGVPGEGNVLGQAAPTVLQNGLPSNGIMEFDTFDLDRLENDGSLVNVIIHEMAHVLGHGTIWRRQGLLVGEGSFDPRFIGLNAMEEFGVLLGTNRPTPVPVANQGGPGTEGAHWREATFGRELLTGRLDSGINPISRISIASLIDLGYGVDLDAADQYDLPDARLLSLLGTEGSGSFCCSPHNH